MIFILKKITKKISQFKRKTGLSHCIVYIIIVFKIFLTYYMQSNNFTLFLKQWSPPIMKKGWNFSQLWNPCTPNSFSSLESLLLNENQLIIIIIIISFELTLSRVSEGRDYYSKNLSTLKISSYSDWNLYWDVKILIKRENITIFKW